MLLFCTCYIWEEKKVQLESYTAILGILIVCNVWINRKKNPLNELKLNCEQKINPSHSRHVESSQVESNRAEPDRSIQVERRGEIKWPQNNWSGNNKSRKKKCRDSMRPRRRKKKWIGTSLWTCCSRSENEQILYSYIIYMYTNIVCLSINISLFLFTLLCHFCIWIRGEEKKMSLNL